MISLQVDINRISIEANLLPRARPNLPVSPRILPQYQGTVPSHEHGHQATNLESETTITQFINPGGPSIQGSYSRATLIRSANYDIDILANLPASAVRSSVAAQAVHPDDGWGFLEQLIGTIEGPADWASQHDYYLYGTPKR